MKAIIFISALMLHTALSQKPALDFQNKLCEGVDVVFLLDTSRSVSLSDFKRELEFTNSIIDNFDIGKGKHQVRVGVVLIGAKPYLQFYLRSISKKETLKYSISHIRHRFSSLTDTSAAIQFVSKYMFRPFFGGRPNSTHVMIVITDGLSQKQKETKLAAAEARKAGTRIFAIGIGSATTELELKNLASNPYDKFMFSIPSFKALKSIKSYFPASACDVPTPEAISFTTSTVLPTATQTISKEEFSTTTLQPRLTSAATTPEPLKKTISTTTDSELSSTTGPESKTTAKQSLSTKISDTPTTTVPKSSISTKTIVPLSTVSETMPNITESSPSRNFSVKTSTQSAFHPSSLKVLLGSKKQEKNYVPKADFVPDLSNELPKENDAEVVEEIAVKESISETFNEIPIDIAISDDPKQYCGGRDADVIFVLDSSSSIWPEDFKKQLEFVNSLVETFDFNNNRTRVGVIVYSNQVHMKVALEAGWTKKQIQRQVSATQYISGLTNTSDALMYLRKYGFTRENARQNALKIGIVLTDGISRNPIETKYESAKSREAGIKLFAIGIGKDIDKTELKRIANDPDDKYVFHVNSFAALATIRSMVAISACGAVPDQPASLLTCGSGSMADVIFVYDAAALGARKSQLLTTFVHEVTRNLQLSPEYLRVGRRTDNCPSVSDIGLISSNDNEIFATLEFPGFEMLVRKLWNVFPGRLDAKNLAVLFVDESSQNIETATMLLKKDKHFKVMVVAIGDASMARIASDMASQPINEYLVNIPSYMSLASSQYEFLQKLCYLITNEPMYLQDARYRQTQ